MKNYIYTTIIAIAIIFALIANAIRLNNKIELLNETLESVYIELQEVRYKSSQNIYENNSENTCILNNNEVYL